MLEGKIALVTGASRGIGRQIALTLGREGASVIVNYNGSAAKAEEVVKEIEAAGGKAEAVQCNVSDFESCGRMMADVVSRYGRLDILVNNAGNHCKKYIEDMTVEDYVNVLNVHLVGAFALTKALFSHMKEQRKGSILFQASMTSYIGQPQVAGYATAKAGYLGLVHTLAAEGGPYGVRVNAIAPGWIDTPMFHKATDGDQVRLGKILGRIPMQKVGSVTDIGMAAVFLSSDAAGYISGTCLPVDGGALIGF